MRWLCSNRQEESQPSRLMRLPSSHCSPACRIASPQTPPPSVVLVVVMDPMDVVVTEVLVVVALHEAMQPDGAASSDTLNVFSSFGSGVAVAVPPQYSSPVPKVKFVAQLAVGLAGATPMAVGP